MRKECKCHGMSGSCTVKTCWMRLPSFRVIGDRIKDRFDGASWVSSSTSRDSRDGNVAQSKRTKKHKNNKPLVSSIGGKKSGYGKKKTYTFQSFSTEYKPPGAEDLVYLEISPGFCDKNPKLGIQGTHGRQCNDTSPGVDGCDLMCCGRGYHTHKDDYFERCNCTFHWCCQVTCDVCKVKRTVHTCL